jgi:hypothetical protein
MQLQQLMTQLWRTIPVALLFWLPSVMGFYCLTVYIRLASSATWLAAHNYAYVSTKVITIWRPYYFYSPGYNWPKDAGQAINIITRSKSLVGLNRRAIFPYNNKCINEVAVRYPVYVEAANQYSDRKFYIYTQKSSPLFYFVAMLRDASFLFPAMLLHCYTATLLLGCYDPASQDCCAATTLLRRTATTQLCRTASFGQLPIANCSHLTCGAEALLLGCYAPHPSEGCTATLLCLRSSEAAEQTATIGP